jgi:hypothetical protein
MPDFGNDVALAAGLSFDPTAIDLLIEERRAQRRAAESQDLENRRLLAEAAMQRNDRLSQMKSALDVQALHNQGQSALQAQSDAAKETAAQAAAKRDQPLTDAQIARIKAETGAAGASSTRDLAQANLANSQAAAVSADRVSKVADQLRQLRSQFNAQAMKGGATADDVVKFDPNAAVPGTVPPELLGGDPAKLAEWKVQNAQASAAATNAYFGAVSTGSGGAQSSAELEKLYRTTYGTTMLGLTAEEIARAENLAKIDLGDPASTAAAKLANNQEVTADEGIALTQQLSGEWVKAMRSGKTVDRGEIMIMGKLWSRSDSAAKMTYLKSSLEQAGNEIALEFGLDEEAKNVLLDRLHAGISAAATGDTSALDDIIIGANPDKIDAALLREQLGKRAQLGPLNDIMADPNASQAMKIAAQVQIDQFNSSVANLRRGNPEASAPGTIAGTRGTLNEELKRLTAKTRPTPAEITRRNQLKAAVNAHR